MINRITNCTNRKIIGNFRDIKEVVDVIKSPTKEQIELVNLARTFDRNSDSYKNIKVHQLHAVCINFNFSHQYIIGKNVDQSTGYLYIDVDGKTEQDFEINSTFVCAHWRSLSNTGVTVVVKVEGLTPDNVKQATITIASILEIPLDKNAISLDRLTVLSYDPEAYYNDSSEVIQIGELLEDTSANSEMELKKETQHNNIKNTILKGYECDGTKLRFDNLDEVLRHREIVFDDNGFCDLGAYNKVNYAQVFVPFKTLNIGSRENVLKSIAYQLVALNKNMSHKPNISRLIKYINKKICFPLLSIKEIDEIIDKIYRKYEEIEPIENEDRRFIYDHSKNLSSATKRRLNISQINKDRSDKTFNELLEVLKNWDTEKLGKITIKSLAQQSKKNRKTVAKYYPILNKHLKKEFLPTPSLKNKYVFKVNSFKDLDSIFNYDFKK